ncbi:MAG: MBL fold metallo-hydrolase, partial [Rhodospirillales bacterium]|nr:MBL fold metallo-hydrolase [Rhodospirillales bacterium]
MKTKTVGDVTIDTIWEAGGPYRPPSEVYPDVTPETVERHRPWMIDSCMEEATGFLIFAFQSYLIRTPRHTI